MDAMRWLVRHTGEYVMQGVPSGTVFLVDAWPTWTRYVVAGAIFLAVRLLMSTTRRMIVWFGACTGTFHFPCGFGVLTWTKLINPGDRSGDEPPDRARPKPKETKPTDAGRRKSGGNSKGNGRKKR
ncbi:hypothetical protein C8D88_102768 [Lentzea atacamensis]|uniref:Uncharacterized protein n=1 Tax=Lentzea atacamensis TaxID=531938 RepID=A0A316IAW3_9PSEU|nr:hypothetical protein C8D88_102768 [Lentzea atacamensis]